MNTGIYNRHIYISIKNIPDTDYDSSAKFCYSDKTEVVNIVTLASVMWCINIYTGKYLLYQQNYNPAGRSIINIREIHIYGKLMQLYDLNGYFFLYLNSTLQKRKRS